jgi:hypothetical protein
LLGLKGLSVAPEDIRVLKLTRPFIHMEQTPVYKPTTQRIDLLAIYHAI